MFISFIAKKSSKSEKLLNTIIEKINQQNLVKKHTIKFTEYAGHAVELAQQFSEIKQMLLLLLEAMAH